VLTPPTLKIQLLSVTICINWQNRNVSVCLNRKDEYLQCFQTLSYLALSVSLFTESRKAIDGIKSQRHLMEKYNYMGTELLHNSIEGFIHPVV